MATSALLNLVDRSGFSLLQANHSVSANLAETFTFPSGTWSVQAVTVQVDSSSNRGTQNWLYSAIPDATLAAGTIGQSTVLWHQTASAQPIAALPATEHSNFYSDTASKYIDTWTYIPAMIAFQPEDQLYLEGMNVTGNVFITVTALRLV